MSIQKADFPDGGFVLHRIPASDTGRVSAWYDKAGRPLDAEQVDNRGRSRPVKKGGPIWQVIETYGQRYVGRGLKPNPAMTRLMPHGRHEKVETKIRRKSSTGEYVVSLYIDNVKQRAADYFTTDRADAQATARLMMERGVKSNPRGKPRAGKRLPQAARGPWGAPVKVWRSDGFTLRLYDTNVPTGTGRLGETYLAYEFFDGAKRIFTGDRYRVAPGYAIDSMAAVYGLLGFLSLKPGDTDDEYFKDYTPEQMAWVGSGRVDDLAMIVMFNEERAGRREYRRRIR